MFSMDFLMGNNWWNPENEVFYNKPWLFKINQMLLLDPELETKKKKILRMIFKSAGKV